jgi:hypothetical protein
MQNRAQEHGLQHIRILVPENPRYQGKTALARLEAFLWQRFPEYEFEAIATLERRPSRGFMILTRPEDGLSDEKACAIIRELTRFDLKQPVTVH